MTTQFFSTALAGGLGYLAAEYVSSLLYRYGGTHLAKLGGASGYVVEGAKGLLAYVLYRRGGKLMPVPMARGVALGMAASAVVGIVNQVRYGGGLLSSVQSAIPSSVMHGLMASDLSRPVSMAGLLPPGSSTVAPPQADAFGSVDLDRFSYTF